MEHLDAPQIGVRKQLAVMTIVLKAEGDPYVSYVLRDDVSAKRAVDKHRIMPALSEQKLHSKSRSDLGDSRSVDREGASVLIYLSRDRTELQIELTTRMRLDRRGIHVAFDAEIVVFADVVVYALVHCTDIVSVEFNVILLGYDMHARLFVHGSGRMKMNKIIFIPFNVAEIDEVDIPALPQSQRFAAL